MVGGGREERRDVIGDDEGNRVHASSLARNSLQTTSSSSLVRPVSQLGERRNMSIEQWQHAVTQNIFAVTLKVSIAARCRPAPSRAY